MAQMLSASEIRSSDLEMQKPLYGEVNMGLDNAAVKFLCAAQALGVKFDDTLMVGRQCMMANAEELGRVFTVLGVREEAAGFLRTHAFGEAFFKLLGATTVASLDFSPFEEATIIHDMNRPIPSELAERFTVVHDGGTLEHIFNLPQAISNCMEMVAVGGHFTQVSAANNYMGHGFWQISPELIYRVFSPANGFQLKAVLLHEVTRGGAWYAVADPNEVCARVELCNKRPTYILTIAQRVSCTPIFSTTPQQSDYAAAWERFAKNERSRRRRRRRRRPRFNTAHYRRLDEQELLYGRLGDIAT